MNQEVLDLLSEIKDQSIYVSFEPDNFDFTDKDSSKEIGINLQNGKSVTINLNDSNTPFIISILRLSVFSKGMKVICWNWKNLATYVLAVTSRSLFIEGAIIDLKILESYSGRKMNKPKSLKEATSRLREIVSNGTWKEVENIYKGLHVPLSTSVIPHLETTGIIDVYTGSKVYAHYEIDGQDNGRLRCFNAFKHGYVPHAMKPETKNNLKPRFFDELFMVFDFRAMEVFMLSWLSKDPVLEELCQENDIYFSLYEKLMGCPPQKKNDRDLIKKVFLPVIYGQSSYMLGQRCDIPKEAAESIVNRIDSLFPTALNWIKTQQKQLQDLGYAKDIFGKRRFFDEGKEYLVRNFCIQSPAAVVCLEKLAHLYFAIKDNTDIAYTVHDGYAIYAKKDDWKKTFNLAHDVLSGASDFCPGLRLKVTCRAGRKLDDLKPLNKK
jgi:hypothetical protein